MTFFSKLIAGLCLKLSKTRPSVSGKAVCPDSLREPSGESWESLCERSSKLLKAVGFRGEGISPEWDIAALQKTVGRNGPANLRCLLLDKNFSDLGTSWVIAFCEAASASYDRMDDLHKSAEICRRVGDPSLMELARRAKDGDAEAESFLKSAAARKIFRRLERRGISNEWEQTAFSACENNQTEVALLLMRIAAAERGGWHRLMSSSGIRKSERRLILLARLALSEGEEPERGAEDFLREGKEGEAYRWAELMAKEQGEVDAKETAEKIIRYARCSAEREMIEKKTLRSVSKGRARL